METLHAIEITVTFWVQSLGSGLAPLMKAITRLGNEEFYLLVMPLLFWSIEPSFGIRIGIMLLISNWVNGIAKLSIHSARPYWFDANVRAYISESSFGPPSGHAQNAASLWGLAAASINKTWVTILMVVIIFLIGFSRIFLGVHFLSDVLLGWILGGLLVFLFLRIEPGITRWVKSLPLKHQLGYTALATLVMLLVGFIPYWFLSGWQIPAQWMETILITSPDHLPNPVNASGLFTLTGTFFGIASGAAWFLSKYQRYDVSGNLVKRILRFLVGLVGILVLWFGLGQIFPSGEAWLPYLLRFIRYTLVCFWMSAIAPWVFIQLKLSSSEKVFSN